jgi:hypothetical protein
MRRVELGKLFDAVSYQILEIHNENKKLARSVRETLNHLGDFSETWVWNSEHLKHLTPYDFLVEIENAFTLPHTQGRAQLTLARAYDTPRPNWANLVKKAGTTLSDSRSKQSDPDKETKDAILNDLEGLIKERGRELAEGLKNRRNSLVQGWQDELRHLAGLSSLETEMKSRFGAEMKSSLGTVTKSSPETEMKIEDSRFRGKGKAVRMPQNV